MNKKIMTVTLIALALDQISKVIASSYLDLNHSVPLIKNFFYLTLCHNEGVAWGLFSNLPILPILFAIVALIIIYHFIYCFKDNIRNNIAFGLLLGGLAGNLIDRLIFGYVRDFIDLIIIKYDYPVFNIADICIVFGVILLIIAMIKGEEINVSESKPRKRKNRQISSK